MSVFCILILARTSAPAEEKETFREESSLQNEVVGGCRHSLAKGASRRREICSLEDWYRWRKQTLQIVWRAFPVGIPGIAIPEHLQENEAMGGVKADPVEGLQRLPVRARLVSQLEFEDVRVENIVFESFPGWEVNGTVYLPKKRGVYPGVVCPTGHGSKTGTDYQRPARVFARNGYITISFDAPGFGELANLNDHFRSGVVSYLTGFWSQTHFVLDAVRCVDYLLSRSDVDAKAGISMTGVSGGGMTSIFAALLDKRVAFVAPVCCLADHESLHLNGLYTSCPEVFGRGYIAAGLDYVDYLAALAPTPCLIVGGKDDEVFNYRSTERLFGELRRVYNAAGRPDQCGLFIDENSGHAYTVEMASEVVRWMNWHIKKSNVSPLPLKAEDLPLFPHDKLLCHPKCTANMFTINRDEAVRLKAERQKRRTDAKAIREAARVVLGLPVEMKLVESRAVSKPRTSWNVLVEELEFRPSDETRLPSLMFTHVAGKNSQQPGVLWIDEEGRWAALRHNAFLCQLLNIYDRDLTQNQPHILSMDVSGLGRLSPEPTAYDLAPWNDIEQILTYLSIANGKPVMGLRVRDALCGLAYLRQRPEVDASRIIVGGRGVGAIVAIHAALLDGHVQRVVCLEMLSHYGALTEQFPFMWRQSVIIPDILKYYDLPDVADALSPCKVFIINPLDAQKKPLNQEAGAALYPGAVVHCGVDGGAAVREAIQIAR